MVEREAALEPVLRQLMAVEERPGVVDEHIDATRRRQEIAGKPAQLGEARQIGGAQRDLRVGNPGPDPRERRGAAPGVTADENERGAAAGQFLGRLEADTGRRAGDETGLAVHEFATLIRLINRIIARFCQKPGRRRTAD